MIDRPEIFHLGLFQMPYNHAQRKSKCLVIYLTIPAHLPQASLFLNMLSLDDLANALINTSTLHKGIYFPSAVLPKSRFAGVTTLTRNV